MGRWADLEEDEHRLPDGMQRIAYDADTQRYTFRDRDGSHWESSPGARYGRLQRAGSHTVTTPPTSSPTSPIQDKQDKTATSEQDPFADPSPLPNSKFRTAANGVRLALRAVSRMTPRRDKEAHVGTSEKEVAAFLARRDGPAEVKEKGGF